ncbi:MAG: class I SAM-dependent methyltransferase, partial [Nitrososphaerales archaeon]
MLDRGQIRQTVRRLWGWWSIWRATSTRTALLLATRRRIDGQRRSLTCDLHRFSFFDNYLDVRGRIIFPTGTVVGLELHIPDQGSHWADVLTPCPVNGHEVGDTDDGSVQLEFAIKQPCRDEQTAVASQLRVAQADGSWLILEGLRENTLETSEYGSTWRTFWSKLSKIPNGRLLEVGSRGTSPSRAQGQLPSSDWSYVGFDVMDGPNVDVCGDAHELGRYFPKETFDAVVSLATFEHLAMPWKVVLELNAVLKMDGLVCIVTHQTWPIHEEPSDFWRFSGYSWNALFNAQTGFELEAWAMGEQADVVPRILNAITVSMPCAAAYLG